MDSDQRRMLWSLARAAVAIIAVVLLLTVIDRSGTSAKDTPSNPAPASSPAPSLSEATRAVQIAAEKAASQPLCKEIPDLASLSLQSLLPPGVGTGSSAHDGGVNVTNAVIVTEPSSVQGMARQLCALPLLPVNPQACLASPGNWLQLLFVAADGEYWVVWTDTGGCMQVSGIGDQTRTAVPDKKLWPTVTADLRSGHELGA
jgi:hypothetical protein